MLLVGLKYAAGASGCIVPASAAGGCIDATNDEGINAANDDGIDKLNDEGIVTANVVASGGCIVAAYDEGIIMANDEGIHGDMYALLI